MEIRICESAGLCENTGISINAAADGSGRIKELISPLGMERKGEHRVILDASGISEDNRTENIKRTAAVIAAAYYYGAYRFSKEGLKKLDRELVFEERDQLCSYGSGRLSILCGSEDREAAEEGLRLGTVFAACQGYARTLGNLPANYLDGAGFADYCRKLADSCGLECRVLGRTGLKEMGCGGILAVNRGSRKEAQLVLLEYHPQAEEMSYEPVGLVGKGVMYDSGGYVLKGLKDMYGMKADMCGAASTAELLEFAAVTGSARPILAALPLVENLIGPDAVRPGDVITTMSGKTVEIYNTDAEGRLILCDGLTCIQRMGVSEVYDLATLTNGCHEALGDDIGGFFCNDDDLAVSFEAAAEKSGELFCRLPLHEIYHRNLKWSDCADLVNYAPGKAASASHGACFLEEFIEKGTKWLHVDVVGPAVRRGSGNMECAGATGVGMASLAELVFRKNRNEDHDK